MIRNKSTLLIGIDEFAACQLVTLLENEIQDMDKRIELLKRDPEFAEALHSVKERQYNFEIIVETIQRTRRANP